VICRFSQKLLLRQNEASFLLPQSLIYLVYKKALKEQITLPLSENFIEVIQFNKENKGELLFLELETNRAKIEDLLSGYHFASRGKVDGHYIEKETIQFNNILAGSFKLHYNVVYTNGCQDLTYNDTDTKVITFEIDLPKRTVLLTGEEIRERMPDEF
jgi:hypothetical protein